MRDDRRMGRRTELIHMQTIPVGILKYLINKQGWIQKIFPPRERVRKDYVCKGIQGLILVMFQLM